MDGKEKQVVGYMSTAHALTHVLELTFAAVLLKVEAEYGTGLFALGLIANVSALLFGVGALPAGILADKIGSKRLLTIGFVAAGGFSLLVGVSHSIPMLGIGLTGLGMAIGLYHPAGLSFISRSVRSQPMAFGYHGIVGNVGIALTPVMAGALASAAGWRSVYLVLAGCAVVLAGLIHFSPLDAAKAPPRATSEASYSLREELRPLLLPLGLLFAASMLTGFIYRGALTFIPAYMTERMDMRLFSMSPSTLAESFATVALLWGILGQYVGGLVAGRIPAERLTVILAGPLVLALLLMAGTRNMGLVFAVSLFAFFHFAGQPIYNTLISKYSPVHLRGSSYGVSFLFTFGLGSFAAGFSGYIAEHAGTQWVFVTLAGVACLLLLVMAYFLRLYGQWQASKAMVVEAAGEPALGR